MSKIEGLQEYLNKLDNIVKAYNNLPTEVAAIAVSFTKDRFRSQDWYDTNRESWPARKRQRGGKKRSQTLLADTARLKRSIRKILADRKQVVIGTDVPYAQIHNDGGKITKSVTVKSHSRRRKSRGGSTTVRSHTRRMNLTIPKRQFIGESNRLEMELFLHIDSRLQTALTQKS
jgi:phage gpG-like protein